MAPLQQPWLTREQAIEILDLLIKGYSTEDFQRRLHEAWDHAGNDLVAQGKARQAVCLEVQGPIIQRYGFEATRKGVSQSVKAFDQVIAADDPGLKERIWLVGWLVNPADQRASEDKFREATLVFARTGAWPPEVVVPKSAQEALAEKLEGHPDTKPVAFDHLDHGRKLHYGGFMHSRRAPSAFLALPPKARKPLACLMDYLREDPAGPFCGGVDEWPQSARVPTEGRWGQFGFDVGANGREQLLKADWHSVNHWGPKKQLFVPRSGENVDIVRAPPRLMAFLECFREVNFHIWVRIVEALEDLQHRADRQGQHSLVQLATTMCQVLRDRGQFGAIEAQVWWGPERTPTRSHKDGATSLLHLSLTLSGRRTLRVGTFSHDLASGPQPTSYSSKAWMQWQEVQKCEAHDEPKATQCLRELNVWDDEAWWPSDLQKISMVTGSVYVSSPFIFEHGVMYERCKRNAPVIALQCRLAFLQEGAALNVNDLRDEDMLEVSTVIAHVMKGVGDEKALRMPTLKEVMCTEARIAQQMEKQAVALAGGRYDVTRWIFTDLPPPRVLPCDVELKPIAQGHTSIVKDEDTDNKSEQMGPVYNQSSDEQDDKDLHLVTDVDVVSGALKSAQVRLTKPPVKPDQKVQSCIEKEPGIELGEARLSARDIALQYAQTHRSMNFKQPPHSDNPQIWLVVGGIESGGLVVRREKELSSTKFSTRLQPGAFVEALEIVGSRLHYRRLQGDGPDFGWVTIQSADGRVLMERDLQPD